MSDTFQLPVTYKGKDLEFDAQLVTLGYTYKIQVDVNGVTAFFEPDEERQFRAYVDPSTKGADKLEADLLQAIVEAIEGIVT